jgi:hypothetical protein
MSALYRTRAVGLDFPQKFFNYIGITFGRYNLHPTYRIRR